MTILSVIRATAQRGAPAAIAGLLAVACGAGPADVASGESASAGAEVVDVVTTLYPLEYFAGRIGGARARVSNLIGPGVEAHSFEPTSQDMRAIGRADILLYNGRGFERWVKRALVSLGNDAPVAIEAADVAVDTPPGSDRSASDSGEEDGQGADPHVWLDPVLAAEQVAVIRDAFSAVRPESSDHFKTNADALIEDLRALDSRFRAGLANCEMRSFVTAHSAFSYLAARYGLEQIAIAGISPDAEPRPKVLARIADEMRSRGIKHVLVEPITSPQLAETLASETGAQVLVLHPLASLTPAERAEGETYFSLMARNLAVLETVLGCGG